MGKNNSDRVRPPGTSWPIPLAVAITLTLLAEPLRGLFDGVSELLHFRDRAIGHTVVEGLDASGYAENYIRLQTLLAALAFGVYFLLARLRRWLDGAISPRAAAAEHRWIARLSEIWIALAILELFRRDPFLATLGSFCGHAVFLVLMVLAARIASERRRLRPGGREEILPLLLRDRPLLAATLFLPLSLIFAVWVLSGRPISFAGGTVSSWFLGVVAPWAGILALHRLAVRRRLGAGPEPAAVRALGTRLAAAAVPLLLIPASLPLANELQYRFPSFAPETLARLAVVGLGLASLALYGLFGRRPPRFSTASLLHNVTYPVFLATCALFKTHQHRRFLGGLDYFHLGEETVPTQQWLEFGSVPLVDLRLAHTFSDMFYQGLYSLVHGYRGLDMLTWISFMPEVLAVVLLYFVVARVVSPGFSLLAVALMPILGTVSEYFAVTFVPALALHYALARPTWVRFAVMWASFLGLALWRIDFGMIGAVALALVLGVYLLRSPAHRWRAALAGLAPVVAAALAGFFLFMLWSDRPAFASIASLFKSYSYRLITRTRTEIIAEYNPLAVLQYYLLPAVSLVYIVYYGVAKLLRRGYLERYKVMLVLVAIFSLALSVRSLERHSLIEKFNPYYFVFLLAFLPFLLRPTGSAREAHGPRLVCLAVLIANAVLLVPVSLYGAGRHQMHHLMKPGPVFEFHHWEEGAQRVFYHREKHQTLVDFLERELTGEQTFFDFTNSPLLYVLTDKRFPTYVIPNLIQTAEPIQEGVVEDLTALHDAGLLPYVVFKQGHHFWDRTDGVANEVRSYRIAEFIYRRYEPLARFGGYEVWCLQGDRSAELPGSDRAVTELGLATEPGAIRTNDLQARIGEEGIVLAAGGVDPYAYGLFDLSATPLLTSKGHWLLELDYSSTATGDLQVFFSLDGGRFEPGISAVGRFRAGSGQVTVPLPVRETAERLTEVRLDPPAHSAVTLRRAALHGYDGKILPLEPQDVDQSFDLRRLPYVWGRYDPLAAASRTPVLAALRPEPAAGDPAAGDPAAGDPARLDRGMELVLPLDPAVDKTLGNYLHLRLRPGGPLADPAAVRDGETTVTVSYGEGLENGFTFEVVAWPEGSQGAWTLEMTGSPVMVDAESFHLGERLIFEAAGADPQVYRVFDLQVSPPAPGDAAVDGELFLRLRYRSSTAGGLQVFYSFDEQPFSEDRSRSAEIVKTTDHGESAVAVVPVGVPTQTSRLTDIRFDIPQGSLFEVVGAEILRRPAGYEDYLVRLSSQWKWMSEPVSRLVLTASGPVEVGEVLLRGGD